MTDLSATGAHDAAGFTNRIIWEVVVKDVLLAVRTASITVETLRVVSRAESGRHQRLCLASGKESRAMRSRQHAHFALNGAQLVERATIKAFALLQN